MTEVPMPTETSKSNIGNAIAIALLCVGVYLGLVVTLADQYLHADLSLSLRLGVRTLVAVLGGLIGAVIFIAGDDLSESTSTIKFLVVLGLAFIVLGTYF